MYRDAEWDSPVDPLVHVAHALALDAWDEVAFVVAMATTVYADASGGNNDEPIYLVAGFWNSITNWDEFGREWKEFLKKWRITCFHQVRDKKHPENDWWKEDESTRNQAKAEAYSIIQRSGAVGMAYFTVTADWHAYVAERRLEGFDEPDTFGFNAFRFIAHVDGWRKDRHLRSMPEFVFETSNKNEKQALIRVADDYGLPTPIFRSKYEEDPERQVVALQAADFLAYEIYRGWKQVIASGGHDRYFLNKFELLEHEWGWADKAKLDGLIPVSAIQLRLEKVVAEIRITNHDEASSLASSEPKERDEGQS